MLLKSLLSSPLHETFQSTAPLLDFLSVRYEKEIDFFLASAMGATLILAVVYAQVRNSPTQLQDSSKHPEASPKQRVANDSSGLYFKDRDGVYIFNPRDCGFLGCIGPDTRPEPEKYRKIPEADVDSFQILIDPKGEFASSGQILARDRSHIFYGGEYVPTGDLNTLQVLEGYAKDRTNLYYRGLVITSLDTGSVRLIGADFIADRDGLYLANSNQPRKAALLDYQTFKFLPRPLNLKSRNYVAEDKNFYYYSDGGSYRVDSKPNANDFKKLGCGYYYFGGRIFHSVYELAGADAATFRVLDKHQNPDQDIETCQDFYAVDRNHRYQFDYQVRPDDTYRNHEIEMLLATPEDKKRLSGIKYTYICVPEKQPGVNFGFGQVRSESANPGTIKMLHFFDADILEAQLINADGQWQPLPSITQRGLLDGCNSVGVHEFLEVNKKPWYGRRDPASVSLVVNQFGEEPVFVVADSSYSIKLAFSKTSLIQLLRDKLGSSSVTPFDNDAPWGSGWILENKFFMNVEHLPEVWIPLRIKNGPDRYSEGREFVTVGFKYDGGQFQCVDSSQCSNLNIPQKFQAKF
jgi:hypothetical protein